MYLQIRRLNKYDNQSSTYNGVIYHSHKERSYAQELDLRVKAGELKEWKRQVPIDLVVNGIKICRYYIDFVEIDPKGNETYVEIKGYETAVWRLKWRLFDALFPALDKKVVK